MATSGLDVKQIIENITKNKETYTKIDLSHLGSTFELGKGQADSIASALMKNTHVAEVNLASMGIADSCALIFGEVLKVNSTITYLDLGYNKISGKGMCALADGFAENTALTECKLHRQADDMGTKSEDYVVKFWEKNTTLTRLYITLHDRRCNQANTAAEVRNKSIAKLVKAGKSWDHLDPAKAEENKEKLAAEQKAKQDAEKEKNKPISEKIASTGGPYTYKQLICTKKFRPDDVDTNKRETYLSDDEFNSLFKMTKDEFEALPQWKKLNKKKTLDLH